MLKVVLLITLISYNFFKLKDGLYNLQINNYNNKKYKKWLKNNFITIYKKSDILIVIVLLSLLLVVKIEIKIISITIFIIILIINNIVKLVKQGKDKKIINNNQNNFINILIFILMMGLVLLTFMEKNPYLYILLMSILNIFLYYLIALFNVKLKVSKKD